MKMIHNQTINLMMLFTDSSEEIEVPAGSQIIHAQIEPGDASIQIWYEFPLDDPARTGLVEKRKVFVFETGHLIPDRLQHRFTCVGKQFVWHVYE